MTIDCEIKNYTMTKGSRGSEKWKEKGNSCELISAKHIFHLSSYQLLLLCLPSILPALLKLLSSDSGGWRDGLQLAYK